MAIRTPILDQLHSRAILPALAALGLDSPAARNLVLGTAAQETGGAFLAQYPSGPALGFWQMEPATASDIWQSLLRISDQKGPKSELYPILSSLCVEDQDSNDQIATNLVYAAALCRLKYWLVPEALPAADDVMGLAAYWKRYYNTPLGAGTVEEFAGNFGRLIGPPPNGEA